MDMMVEEVDTDDKVQYSSFYIKSEQAFNDNRTVNICTGSDARDNYPNYSLDTESSETAKNTQNVEVPKTEQSMEHRYVPSSCNASGSRDKLFPHQNGISGKRYFNEPEHPSRLCSDGPTYAICIKYEPDEDLCNMTEQCISGSNTPPRKQFDQAQDYCSTVDNSYCYKDCRLALDGQSQDFQIKYEPIKCEIQESSVPENAKECDVTDCSLTSDNSVCNFHEHDHTYSKCYEDLHYSDGKITIPKLKGSGDYKCDICSYCATSPSHLEAHKRVHRGEKPYKCGVCSYSATNANYLAVHERMHMLEETLECDVCRNRETPSGNLTKQKRKHPDEKSFMCDMCSYHTKWSRDLAAHKRKHTGEKPYKCELCSYSTVQSEHLKIHKRKHTGEKPYKCDVCSYSTAQSGHLERHKRKHTGEKPYKCELCSYSTAWPSALAMHRRRHTDEKV